VKNNIFDPGKAGIGTHTINYDITGNGCANSTTATITVNPLPIITLNAFEPDSVPLNHGVLDLPVALPEGGTYTGVGVYNNIFDPVAAGLGEHFIMYTYSDENSCTNSASTRIKVYQSVGVDIISDKGNIKIYPNPSNGLFYIECDNDYTMTLIDAQGKVISNKEIRKAERNSINMNSHQPGVYFVRFLNDKWVRTRKIVIK